MKIVNCREILLVFETNIYDIFLFTFKIRDGVKGLINILLERM